jgi:hypothetical protein
VLRAADATARSNPWELSKRRYRTFRSGGDWDRIGVCPVALQPLRKDPILVSLIG